MGGGVFYCSNDLNICHPIVEAIDSVNPIHGYNIKYKSLEIWTKLADLNFLNDHILKFLCNALVLECLKL